MALQTLTYTDSSVPKIEFEPVQIEDYRGFHIIRKAPYMLYYIQIPAAQKGFTYDIVARLKGSYTKIVSCKQAIDKFFIENPTAGVMDAFLLIANKRPRGRPSSAAKRLEQQLADQEQQQQQQQQMEEPLEDVTQHGI
jgi:hypothetical protein